MSWLSSALHGIGKVATNVGKAVKGAGHFIGDKLMPLLVAGVSFIPVVGQIAAPILSVIGNVIKTGGGLKDVIKGLPATVLSAIPGGSSGIGTFLQGTIGAAIKAVPGLGSGLASLAGTIANSPLGSLVGKAVSGIGGFIGSALKPVTNLLGSTASGLLGGAAKQALGTLASRSSATPAVGGGGGAGSVYGAGGIIDPNDPLGSLLNAGTAVQGALAGAKGEKYASQAGNYAGSLAQQNAPIRALATSKLLGMQRPDLTSTFAGTDNPFATPPQRFDDTGHPIPAAPVPTAPPVPTPTPLAAVPQAPPTPSFNLQAQPLPALPPVPPPLAQAPPPVQVPGRPLSLAAARV